METENYLNATTRSYGAQQLGYVPKNDYNILSKMYDKRRQYSSWAMYGEPTTDTDGDTVIVDSYSQLNFFFKLNYDDDPLLRDLMMANITARKSLRIGMVKNNRSTGVDAVHTDDFVSFNPKKRFKCFRLIHSTAISVAPLDNALLPVKNSNTFTKFDHDLSELYSKDKAGPKYLCMIPLHPNRRALPLHI